MKKKFKSLKVFTLFLTVLLGFALLFQNCSQINISAPPITPPPVPNPTATPPISPPPTPPPTPPIDLVNYNETNLENPPGGTDPVDLDTYRWWHDLTYGSPNPPINCSYRNWEDGTVQSALATIATGKSNPNIPFAFASASVGARFSPMYLYSFRIHATELSSYSGSFLQGGGASFTYWDANANQFRTHGFQISLSRRPCEFRETTVSELINTEDYCTIGNTFDHAAGYAVEVPISVRVRDTWSYTQRVCTLQRGLYYYLNIVNFNQSDPGYRAMFGLSRMGP